METEDFVHQRSGVRPPGRLHRLDDNKREVIVYDYVDGCVPVLSAMYGKRVRGYEAIGYQIQDEE